MTSIDPERFHAPLNRRTVLKAAGATATVAALSRHGIAPAAVAAGPAGALLANIVGSFAGTAETNGVAAVQPKLTALYTTAKKNLAALVANPTDALFKGLTLGSSDKNLASTAQKLYEIAIATAMPLPSTSTVARDLSGNTAVEDRVVDALGWLHDHYLADQSKGYYGNWFNWEIAVPRYAGRALALLAGRLPARNPDLATRYVATLDGYLRHGKNGDVDLDSRFDTGANLADMTTNRIVQGALTGDDARITKAIADQMTVYRVIDPYNLQHEVTDGFYADGSFIQHASVAYTGSYGVELLKRATETIALLAGTEHAIDGDFIDQVDGWLSDSFAPILAYGWVMEIVKGRSVSRTKTGYDGALGVVEPVVALSQFTDAETTRSLQGYVRHLHDIRELDIDPTDFENPADIVAYASIVSDPSVTGADLLPASATFAFNAMDRNVHRRPGYTFALARSSSRVSPYEYMSGENLVPWFQGDGMHYLYLPGDDQAQAYGAAFFTDVSPYRLPGTTVPVEERKTVPQLYGEQFYDNPAAGFTSDSVQQNTYVYFPLGTNAISGSAHLHGYAVAAMVQSDDAAYAAKQAGQLPSDFVVYANARSTKSWFMLDDEIVVLAAGIGDEHGRDVVTTIDSRISAPDDDVTMTGRTRDGRRVTRAGVVANPSWLLHRNLTREVAVGYAFLDLDRAGSTVDIARSVVSDNLRSVYVGNPDQSVAKTVSTLSVSHPARTRQPGRLAYAIVPNADERGLERFARERAISLVANSTAVQAVRHRRLRLLGGNVFGSGWARIGAVWIDGAASFLARQESSGSTTIAVSDPSFARDRVQVLLPGYRLAVGAHPGVTVDHSLRGTLVTVDTHHAYGATRSLTVRGGGIA